MENILKEMSNRFRSEIITNTKDGKTEYSAKLWHTTYDSPTLEELFYAMEYDCIWNNLNDFRHSYGLEEWMKKVCNMLGGEGVATFTTDSSSKEDCSLSIILKKRDKEYCFTGCGIDCIEEGVVNTLVDKEQKKFFAKFTEE
jgi:hypothetical protein